VSARLKLNNVVTDTLKLCDTEAKVETFYDSAGSRVPLVSQFRHQKAAFVAIYATERRTASRIGVHQGVSIRGFEHFVGF
jgi:hypothetical protein